MTREKVLLLKNYFIDKLSLPGLLRKGWYRSFRCLAIDFEGEVVVGAVVVCPVLGTVYSVADRIPEILVVSRSGGIDISCPSLGAVHISLVVTEGLILKPARIHCRF